MEERARRWRQLVEAVHHRFAKGANRAHSLANLCKHSEPLPVARPAGEGIPLDVSRQADSRRKYDVGVASGRVEPTDASIGKKREIERHSITRMRSRRSAASSNCSLSIARLRRSLSSPSTDARSSSSDIGGWYGRPTWRWLPCTRRNSSRIGTSKFA